MSTINLRLILMVVLAIAVCIYAALGALLFIFQSHFVYFPETRLLTTPHEIGLPYEAVSFMTEDGVNLFGWFVPAERQRGVILFCHGNAGNISTRIQSIETFSKLGLSTFIFDYRGYGRSEGRPTEKGTYLDARAAWDYLVEKRGIAPEDIVLFGESLGGSVAAWVAQERKPAALILASAFTSFPDLASDLYPFFPARLLSRYSYDTIAYLRRAECPVLVIHSCDDDIVPYRHGCELFESARDPKEFLELRGDHNTGFRTSGESYVNGIKYFLSTVLKNMALGSKSSEKKIIR